jgi:hypothetical protein
MTPAPARRTLVSAAGADVVSGGGAARAQETVKPSPVGVTVRP